MLITVVSFLQLAFDNKFGVVAKIVNMVVYGLKINIIWFSGEHFHHISSELETSVHISAEAGERVKIIHV